MTSRRIGYFCIYTPEEIISAADITPVRISGNGQSTALADTYLLPRGVCSYIRNCFNSFLKGESGVEAYVMCTTCDHVKNAYSIWREHIKMPYSYLLQVPHSKTKLAYKFFLREIIKFKEWIEDSFGVEISTNSIESAIELYNETRRLLKELYEMRKEDPPLISGAEAYEILLESMSMPKSRFNRIFSGLLDKFVRRKKQREGVRLLLSGSILGNVELIRIIEESGGIVVTDDLCTGTRYFWDIVDEDTDPFSSLAKAYLNRVPCPFMYHYEDRLEHIKRLVKEYRVDGAIFLAMDCCDAYLYNVPIFIDELNKIGIPVHLLEVDYILSAKASLKTKVEAFVESIRKI